MLENPLVKQRRRAKGDREMTAWELAEGTQNAIGRRRNPNPYLVEIHKKFAIPAACLVFAVLGVPLGIRAHRGGRWAAFVALLPIVLFYYVGLTIGENIWRPRTGPALARDVDAQHGRGRPGPVPAASEPEGASAPARRALQTGFWAALARVQAAWPAWRRRRRAAARRGGGRGTAGRARRAAGAAAASSTSWTAT